MNAQTKLGIIAIIVVIPLIASGLWYSSIKPDVQFAEASEVTALVSFYPLLEFTKEVGGELVDASLLVPQGIEPHDWEPTINDIERIKQADLVIINGVGFENWIEDIDEINPNLIIIDSSVGIEIIDWQNQHEEHEEHSSLGDPHIWLNPILAKTQVQNIANGLKQFDPKNEQIYNTNSNEYLKKLDDFDSKITNGLSSCKKDFIVYHNAFSYFAQQYGLTQHTIVKTNDHHAEPTPKDFEDIINLAKELNIDVIFTEEGMDPRISTIIADEFDAKVLPLSPLEIVSDNTTYIENMEKNLANLQKALCK